MKFTKMQGTGNDFVLVETDDMQRDWSKLAIAMCNRHYGIGADGLLLLAPSKMADFRMRIFNADGSEAKACGNGTRCLVKHFVEHQLFKTSAQEVSVETKSGIRKASFIKKAGKVTKVKIGMGKPKLRAEEVPVITEPGLQDIANINSMLVYPMAVNGKRLDLNLVSMGNAHAVHFCHEPLSSFALETIGPDIEHHRIFPDGVNFEVARIIDRRHIEARVWEHGVGETLACGTGSCAINVAAQLHGYIDHKAEIKLLGGALEIEWDGADGEVYLSGPAETVFTGDWTE